MFCVGELLPYMHSAHAQGATLGAFMSTDFISQHAVAGSLPTLGPILLPPTFDEACRPLPGLHWCTRWAACQAAW